MSRGPWSIKGIDSRAREKAREKARRDGLTLGEFMNRLLIEDDDHHAGMPDPNNRYTADHVLADRYQDVIAEVDALADRLRSAPNSRESQRPTATASSPRSTAGRTSERDFGFGKKAVLQDSLADIIDRLDHGDRDRDDLAGRVDNALHDLRATQDALRQRLDSFSSSQDSAPRTMEAMRGLENALSRLARQMHETHLELSSEQAHLRDRIDRADAAATQRSEHHAEEVDRKLRDYESGANESRRRIDESLARLTSEADRLAGVSAANEKRLSQVEQKSETAYETARTLSREMGGRVDALETGLVQSADEMRNRLKALVDATQNRLDEAYDVADTALSRVQDVDQRLSNLGTLASSESVEKAAEEARQALNSAQETATRVSERLEDAQQLSDKKIEDLTEKLQKAVSDAQTQSDELAQRVESALERIDEVSDQKDNHLQEALESTANALRSARVETRDLSDRLTQSLAETQGRLKTVADEVERERAATHDKIEGLENRFNASQQNTAAIMGRVSELGVKADKSDRDNERSAEALSTLQAAMERINERLERAEESSEGALKTLEDQISSLDGRMVDMQQKAGDELRESVQQSLQEISEGVSRTVQTTREELEREIAQTAEAAANTTDVQRLEEKLETLQEQIANTENRQVEAVEVISTQLERMSAALDGRLRDVEDHAGEFDLAQMREDISRISTDLEQQAENNEVRSNTAMSAVSEMADTLDEKVKETESRSARAIEQVGEQVLRVAERLQARQDEMSEDFDSRLNELGDEQQKRLDDVIDDVHRRLDQAGEQAIGVLGPVQDTVASLARRVEGLEDLEQGAAPPPFSNDEDDDAGLVSTEFLDSPLSNVSDDEPSVAPTLSIEANENEELTPSEIADSAHQARREFADMLAEARETGDEFDSTEEAESFSNVSSNEQEDDLSAALSAAVSAFGHDKDPDDEITGIETDDDTIGDEPQFDPVADLVAEREDENFTEEALESQDAPLPSAFAAEDSTLFERSDQQEYEASLPLVSSSDVSTADALRHDDGVDDDPFAHSTTNSLDFLSAARQAALERGDDNRTLSDYGQAPVEPQRGNSKVPILAAGALAVVVGSAAGMMAMRGKQTNSDDFVATPIGSGEQASGQSAENASYSTTDDADLFEDDLNSTDATLFDEPESQSDYNAADLESELFRGDGVEQTPRTIEASIDEPQTVTTGLNTAASSVENTDATNTLAEAPRRVSALEAFASSTPPSPPQLSLEDAAEGGDAVALHDLGLKYLAEGEKKAAADALEKAAESGLAMAQYRLAKLYERGEGVPRSVREAREWTERSAQGGNVKAMHDLAVFYAEGEGGQQSYVGAVEWFTRAANHGLLDSQYNLGVLYEQGLGVSKNMAEAALWFEIAGKNGDADGSRRARDVMSRLSPNEADTARRRAALFSPLSPPTKPNGVFGRKAWEAPLQAQVLEIQRLLNLLNYAAGPADGVMGAKTRAAISRFEADNNLPIKGQASSEILDILRAQSIGG